MYCIVFRLYLFYYFGISIIIFMYLCIQNGIKKLFDNAINLE